MQEELRAQEMSYLGREPCGCANIRCASSTIVQLLLYTLIHGVTLYLLYVDIGYMFHVSYIGYIIFCWTLIHIVVGYIGSAIVHQVGKSPSVPRSCNQWGGIWPNGFHPTALNARLLIAGENIQGAQQEYFHTTLLPLAEVMLSIYAQSEIKLGICLNKLSTPKKNCGIQSVRQHLFRMLIWVIWQVI